MHSYRFVPCVVVALACGGAGQAAPGTFVTVDDFGDTLAVARPPARIASLNPATTELVFAIGAGGRLVGRTHWDTYPDSARAVPDLGDAIRPNVEAIIAAHPDLVLLYASTENRPARDALRRAGIATLAQRINRIDDFASAIVVLGRACGDTARAILVRDTVLASIARARSLTAGLTRPRVVWPVWEAPLLVIGRGSFLNELLDAAGAENVFGDVAGPSPPVTFEEVVHRDPDVIVVPPTRVNAVRRDTRWKSLRAVRLGHVVTYDTMIVGDPGVRLGEAAMFLARALHPELAGQR